VTTPSRDRHTDRDGFARSARDGAAMEQLDVRVSPRPAEVFVVSMGGSVLLMVDGDENPTNRALIDEMRASFEATGTPSDEVQVIWQSARH
jgi:hypothetical protein